MGRALAKNEKGSETPYNTTFIDDKLVAPMSLSIQFSFYFLVC